MRPISLKSRCLRSESGYETKSSPGGMDDDPWADWKPVWTGWRGPSTSAPGTKPAARSRAPLPATPQDFQERQAPTETVQVRLTGTRETEKCRRRILDARLWDALAPEQQDAALQIEYAYQLLSAGIGYRGSNAFRPPVAASTASSETDRQAELSQWYFLWARECQSAQVSHAALLDILCFGKSCKQVDRERSARNGWARANLGEGLALYARLRGWGRAGRGR